jgi:hypothetical protein
VLGVRGKIDRTPKYIEDATVLPAFPHPAKPFIKSFGIAAFEFFWSMNPQIHQIPGHFLSDSGYDLECFEMVLHAAMPIEQIFRD